MALIRNVMDQLNDSTVRATMNEEHYSKIVKPALKRIEQINPYAVSPAAADALEKMGIASHPRACQLHTHGAAKAIENELLGKVGMMLPKDRAATFLFIKPGKVEKFMGRHHTRNVYHNQAKEPKDFDRYPLETIVTDFCRIDTTHAYISDTLHYLKPIDVMRIFQQSPMLDCLIASLVLPVEALYKHPSIHPDIYSINYTHNGFQYLPGSCGEASYSHEFKQLQWLSVGYIYYPMLVPSKCVMLTVQMTESKGANHLFVIRRGELLTPRVRTFASDKMVMLPKIFMPPGLNAPEPLPLKLMNKLFLYAKSVKSVTMKDLFAKVRQMLDDSTLATMSTKQIVHIVNYLYVVANLDATNYSQLAIGTAPWLRPIFNIIESIKQLMRFFTGPNSYEKFLNAISMVPFTYSLEVKKEWIKEPTGLDKLLVGPAIPDWDEAEGSGTSEGDEKERTEDLHKPSTEASIKKSSGGPWRELPSDSPWGDWKELLNNHGFHGDQNQIGPNGELIFPISRFQQLDLDPFMDRADGLEAALRKVKRRACLALYQTERARAYASDVKNNRVGLLLKQQPLNWKAELSLKSEQDSRRIPTVVIHGAGGSGKSKVIQDWLNSKEKGYSEVSVVLPTNELFLDWRNKCPRAGVRVFKTFEKALIQPTSSVVVFDDYGKLPAGYLEAFAMTKGPEMIILTGDPRQSYYHEENPEAYSGMLEPGIKEFDQYSGFYLNCTHRNAKSIANMLGVYSEKEMEISITHTSQPKSGWPTLVPSTIKRDLLNELGRKTYTYAGCQGLTTPKVQIVLDSSTTLCSEEVFYTALSRAETAIHFVNTGPNTREYWDKLDSTPYLKTFLDLAYNEGIKRADPVEPEVLPAPVARTHLPVENAEVLLEPLIEEIPEKHEREIYQESTGFSNCIQTEDKTVQLFQHQQAKDETLFRATMESRLSAGTPDQNLMELVLKKDLGDVLFIAYKKAMNLPPDPVPFEADLWEDCGREIQAVFMSKPVHAIVNGQLRQSPDFPENEIMLFLKSQWVSKVESIGRIKVKPGQTIASFSQQVVMLYGQMARYMRRMRDRFQPENIMIYCEKTPEHVDQFLAGNWRFNKVAHTNDFTEFDKSQDGAMLQFELIKGKFFNIPEDVLEGYKFIKTHAHIWKGYLSIMRLTGEGPTFDANTECNIAYHHTRFDVPPDCCQVYSGDDMAQDAPAVERPSFEKIQDQLKLRAKPKTYKQVKGDWAEFCGWKITPRGLIKDSKKVFSSLLRNVICNGGKDVATSYAIDLARTYRHGDDVQDLMTEEELGMHQASIDRLIDLGQNWVFQEGSRFLEGSEVERDRGPIDEVINKLNLEESLWQSF
nr:MAG: RNA-dependent RNA polymerase [Physalis virus X]